MTADTSFLLFLATWGLSILGHALFPGEPFPATDSFVNGFGMWSNLTFAAPFLALLFGRVRTPSARTDAHQTLIAFGCLELARVSWVLWSSDRFEVHTGVTSLVLDVARMNVVGAFVLGHTIARAVGSERMGLAAAAASLLAVLTLIQRDSAIVSPDVYLGMQMLAAGTLWLAGNFRTCNVYWTAASFGSGASVLLAHGAIRTRRVATEECFADMAAGLFHGVTAAFCTYVVTTRRCNRNFELFAIAASLALPVLYALSVRIEDAQTCSRAADAFLAAILCGHLAAQGL